jgi:hypothetical protein
MLEIECLVCGQVIRLPEYIDFDNYDGQVACRQCSALLHVKIIGSKVRRYDVVERGHKPASVDEVVIENEQKTEDLQESQPVEEADVDKIARYNPLRDFLSTYIANTIHMTFDQIEDIIGQKLDTGAYTLKSWWENDIGNPQAIAWMESGWRVLDINFPQRVVTLIRKKTDDIE